MPRKQFFDVPGCDTITYQTVTQDGYRLFAFFEDEEVNQKNFDSIPHRKMRDDDILLCSYPKAGSHWLWEMLQMVLLRQRTVTNINKAWSMVETFPEERQDSLPSPRLINTHVNYKFIPKEAREKRVKCVLLCRNPKDVVVSFYNHTRGLARYHYEGKFENYLPMFMRGEVDYGCYAAYLAEWQQAIRDNPDWPIYIVYYEDLKQNGFHEMKKLCQYLEQDVDDNLLREIIDNCQVDKMRQSLEEHTSAQRKAFQKAFFKDSYSFVWKGEAGRWKKWFTVAQNEAFDKWWAERTAQIDLFNFKYT